MRINPMVNNEMQNENEYQNNDDGYRAFFMNSHHEWNKFLS